MIPTKFKNYSTSYPATKSVQEIQAMLVDNGASDILLKYEQNTGRIESICFQIEFEGKKLGYRLPLRWRDSQRVMQSQGIKRSDDEDYCYRVAWRNLRDWVEIQMVLYQLSIAKMPEIFLPYTMRNDGKTLYEYIESNPKFLLEQGTKT